MLISRDDNIVCITKESFYVTFGCFIVNFTKPGRTASSFFFVLSILLQTFFAGLVSIPPQNTMSHSNWVEFNYFRFNVQFGAQKTFRSDSAQVVEMVSEGGVAWAAPNFTTDAMLHSSLTRSLSQCLNKR